VQVIKLSTNPVITIDIVRELRDSGLVLGTDFDFKFFQSKWDEMIGEIPQHADFLFYNEKYATMFILKYSKWS
jgi:hypothetical protein